MIIGKETISFDPDSPNVVSTLSGRCVTFASFAQWCGDVEVTHDNVEKLRSDWKHDTIKKIRDYFS